MNRVRFVLGGLIVASALGACVLPGDPRCPPSDPDQPVRVPAVDASGASDVSGPMADFLATVPDGSTIQLRAGGTYRMEQGFRIEGRCNLTIRGNGATFVATSTGVSTRVSVRIEGSRGISVSNLRVVGANPMAGAKDSIFRPELAGQHGFGISRSTNVRLSGVIVTDTDAPAAGIQPLPPPPIPVGFTTFPGEIWRTPRNWVENSYPNVSYFNEVDRGGHFAAWEEPELFSSEVRAAFGSLR